MVSKKPQKLDLASEIADCDLYELLGVDATAPSRLISRAYRQRARDVHPDRNHDNPEAAGRAFDRLRKAYEVLISATLRPQYDAKRRAQEERKRERERATTDQVCACASVCVIVCMHDGCLCVCVCTHMYAACVSG